MSGTIAINTQGPGHGISTSSFVFDVIWRILLERSNQKPFVHDTAYLSSLSWREKSYDCFLDLRKCQRPTLEAIRELMLQHADSNHSYWESYYRDNFAAIDPEKRVEEEKLIRLWQTWAQKAMIQLADAIDKRFKIEGGLS